MNAKEIAFYNDQLIMDLAGYHESKGLTKKINNDQVMTRFSEFKVRIKKGCFTIKDLEDKIYTENGVMTSPPSLPNISNLQELLIKTAEMSTELKKKEQKNEKEQKNKRVKKNKRQKRTKDKKTKSREEE